MMLNFDIRGNLQPYKIMEVSNSDFYEFFVQSFDIQSTRYELFNSYKKYELNKRVLQESFVSKNARSKYKVDAYIIPSYPMQHKRYMFTQADLAYWRNLFGKTRMNRAKKQFEKGIIQLKPSENE